MTVKPDADSSKRYLSRHKWLPDREHRGLASTGDIDAFGDESLYKSSLLGTASIEPGSIEAGTEAPLTIRFTTGPAGLLEGTRIVFAIRGQRPLGQMEKHSITAPDNVTIEHMHDGFLVKSGNLAENQSVTLEWPSFKWTPLAGPHEFKVIIRYPGNTPEQRLPEPLVVQVLPCPAVRLEPLFPCTHPGNTQVELQVTARDRFDNRARLSENLTVKTAGEERKMNLVDGIGKCPLQTSPESITCVSVCCPGFDTEHVSNPCLAVDGHQLFLGDLHCHDFMSEAEGYTDNVYRWAIEDRRLDFVSVVPQSHGWHDNETWTLTKYMNERFLDEGRFVTLLGYEWQHSGYGDKVIHYLGGDQPYLPVDDERYNTPAGLYSALRESDALVISHHPAYPAGSWCSSTDFEAVETDVERLVELWSMHGSSEGFDPEDRPLSKNDPDNSVMSALKRGVRLGFTGGSDTHSARPGGAVKEPGAYQGGITAVWAETLTRRSIFDALYRRRTYALTGARIILRMTINGMPMGSEIDFSENVSIAIEAWAPGVIARVDVMKNAELHRQLDVSSDHCSLRIEDTLETPAFYHSRVVMSDGNLAVCSPVWVG